AEIGQDSLISPKLFKCTDDEIKAKLHECNDLRLFVVYEALRRGITKEYIHDITMIDNWFLSKLLKLVECEKELEKGELSDELYHKAKRLGFPDKVIKSISGCEITKPLYASYKMVDTCAAEFSAQTPYFYSGYEKEDEASEFIKSHNSGKKTVIVFGSGPIRIGQGIEFDYASVHCVWALKKQGFEVVIVNNNPETVSTDFDTADRLYFEPLTNEDVMNVIRVEKPYGVVVAFGGQTAIKLTKYLSQNGVNILGTPADSIDAAEDRERFDELLEKLNIKRPEGFTVMNADEAVKIANRIQYPVLMRPSYVLGGQNMIIAFNDDDIREYMEIILRQNIENPVLIDKYLNGTEIEVDAICDGDDILIPGIMEHIERAGIHSGDSIAVYPAWNVSDELTDKIIDCSKRLAVSLNTMGLVNIQYLIYENELYVIEVNPRSSRTIPYISKVTGVPMVELATRAMLGEKLCDMGFGTGLYKNSPYVAVKVPVFSFEKLIDVDNHLGPEMKSTGEVLAIANTLEESLYKGLIAAGYKLGKKGGVLITVRDSDKHEIPGTAKAFLDLGFKLYATAGTAKILNEQGIDATSVKKIHEASENTLTLIESGKIAYVISTSSKGRIPTRDSVKIRRKTVERNIPCLTSIDTANAIASSIKSKFSEHSTELVNINDMRTEKQKLDFTKMQGCGNDYIYFNCFDQRIDNPEGLSVRLSDRHFGIGGDGVILICRSKIADAKMRMFNLDGSEGKMCGNGIRCVAKFMRDNGLVDKDTMTIETLSGIMKLELFYHGGEVKNVRVNMGKAELDPKKIPVRLDGDSVVNREIEIGGQKYSITCVSMGNPHCVVFQKNVDTFDIEKIGPDFENAPIFPERVNTEFIKVIDKSTLKMRVWERGSGETWACGTGACAAAVAAVLNGYCNKNEDITVKLLGGDLVIRYTDDGSVFMTGNAETVFKGQIVI
ncbi:MAG: carbamoyl-phosphate synthase large subunit, partial [Oscillospiraceae bacterium]